MAVRSAGVTPPPDLTHEASAANKPATAIGPRRNGRERDERADDGERMVSIIPALCVQVQSRCADRGQADNLVPRKGRTCPSLRTEPWLGCQINPRKTRLTHGPSHA